MFGLTHTTHDTARWQLRQRVRTTNERTKGQTMTATVTKKITIATVKAFIRRNRASLLVRVKSCFDGMDDCVRENSDSVFAPAVAREWFCHETGKYIACSQDNKDTLGIVGVWFCGRDWCDQIETEEFFGYRVSNCCGTWFVAIAR